MLNNHKYCIKELLKKAPGKYGTNYYLLVSKLDVNHRTLDRWMALPKDSKSSIPSDELYTIADFLQVKPDQLLNR
jgi:hypothetical protein